LHGGNNPLPGVNASRFVHSGIYSAFLGQNGSLGSLSQTLPTKAGQRYLLSFWLDNPALGTPNEFIAAWNGTTLFDGADLGEFAWTNLQFAVSATSASTALEFMLRTDLTATNTTAFVSDTLGPGPQRFYRIVLLP
jgi:hypothetical protein